MVFQALRKYEHKLRGMKKAGKSMERAEEKQSAK